MRIVKATWFAVIGVLLSLFVVGAAWALPPRVSWEPERLAPASLAPGESATYSLTLVHTGFLPIPATRQLRIVPEGAIAHYVTVIPPVFPPVLKRGDRVSVQVTVTAPADAPLSVVRDEILLERILPNGKTLEVFRAEALPVELTFSPIALPPDPGESGKVTVEGIDSNADGVRDDIERFITLTFGSSAKTVSALRQEAIYSQKALLTQTREESLALIPEMVRAVECMEYLKVPDSASKAITARIINTDARYRAWAADEGRVSGHGWKIRLPDQWKSSCATNPDSLPN